MNRALALAFLISGCHADRAPEIVLRRYTQLLRGGHVEAAYQLTSVRYRTHNDVASFAAQVARQPLVDASRADHDVVLRVDGATGPLLLAGRDAAHLAFTRDPVDAYPHDTPEACLRSFARAVAHDRPDVLKTLFAPALAASFSAGELPEALVSAARLLSQRLEVVRGERPPVVQLESDTHAKVLLGDGVAITLEEQARGWQISQLP